MYLLRGTLSDGQVLNLCESFICLDLIIKNRNVSIERYFK
jgi:hypothetical protein